MEQLAERRWTTLGPSSPLVMPTSASTITTQLKHPGSTAGYTANRLIIQTYIGTTAKIVKEVHLQSGEDLSQRWLRHGPRAQALRRFLSCGNRPTIRTHASISKRVENG